MRFGRGIRTLALGLAVTAAMFGILVAVAVIDSSGPEILQTPSPTAQLRSATSTSVVATSTPTPNPTSIPTPEPTPAPTLPPTPAPIPTLEPTPQPTPPPIELTVGKGNGISMDNGVAVRASPTSASQQVGTLEFGEEVKILSVVNGQMWYNHNQSISPFGAFSDLADDWYELKQGGYVYSAFIFVPKEGEASPFASGERWVEVDRDDQVIHAYVEGKEVFQAPVGVGLPWTPTPLGEYSVWTKIFNETMSGADYHVQNVLFTQYFTSVGHALHLDWWHGDSYFGEKPTSHGCVGLQLHNSQWIWLFGFKGMKVKIYE